MNLECHIPEPIPQYGSNPQTEQPLHNYNDINEKNKRIIAKVKMKTRAKQLYNDALERQKKMEVTPQAPQVPVI